MTATTPEAGVRTPYHARAISVEACNCRHGCNCQFGGFPNEGICEFIIGFKLHDGRFGEVDLAGATAVIAGKYPNAIHEGNGHVVLFVDEKLPDEQANALVTILSGQAGGMPWEALAGTITRFEGPIRRPVEVEAKGQQGHVRVPGAIDLQTEPLRDPVSGEPKEVHISYPNGGFFWNDGNIVTTTSMRAELGDLKLEWPERYGAIAEVNWRNGA